MKASDNPFPSVLIEEGTEPSAPAAGHQRLYIDSSSHKLKRTDSSGTDVTIEGNVSGSTGSLAFVIDGGGSAITTGVKGDVEMPFAGTFTAWRLLADQSGSIVVDVWKDTYANFPPTDADAMPGSGKEPTLSTATNAEDTSITDWTTDDFSAGDIIRFNVDSAATVTRVTLSLTFTRT